MVLVSASRSLIAASVVKMFALQDMVLSLIERPSNLQTFEFATDLFASTFLLCQYNHRLYCKYYEFRTIRRTTANKGQRPRIRRERNQAACDGMGRIAAFSGGIAAKACRAGPDGHSLSGRIWRRGDGLRRIRDDHRRDRTRLRLGGAVGRRPQFALFESYLYVRNRRAEAEISGAARSR